MDDSAVDRATLMAALGCYDDAVAELAEAPADQRTVLLRARIALAAGRPQAALDALDALPAGTVDGDAALLGVRAMALVDLRRFRQAAVIGEAILDTWPAEVDALCLGAGVLAESRNGPRALSAAWDAVRLAPDESRTHLVLGLVAAGLGQYELAERAYAEALDREPDLAEVADDPGVGRFEVRRQHRALERLLGLAAAGTSLKAAGEAPPSGSPADAPTRVPGTVRRRDRLVPPPAGAADAGPALRLPRPAGAAPAGDLLAGVGGLLLATAGVVGLGLPLLGDAARLLAALLAGLTPLLGAVLWARAGFARRPAAYAALAALLAGAVLLGVCAATGAWWPLAAAALVGGVLCVAARRRAASP
ncbi:MAG TPA: hypothetical protein VFY17_01940 [Pilimelia sp.]|nr:hypothetical protein [Pilimelia sp.]